MINTNNLDDKYANVENILQYTSRYKNKNVLNSNVVPEGYMTVEQFQKEAKTSLTKILNERGIY